MLQHKTLDKSETSKKKLDWTYCSKVKLTTTVMTTNKSKYLLMAAKIETPNAGTKEKSEDKI